jgi:hypothetical protein
MLDWGSLLQSKERRGRLGGDPLEVFLGVVAPLSWSVVRAGRECLVPAVCVPLAAAFLLPIANGVPTLRVRTHTRGRVCQQVIRDDRFQVVLNVMSQTREEGKVVGTVV